jgi:hypothetical protein
MKNKKTDSLHGSGKVIPLRPSKKVLKFGEKVNKFNEYSRNPDKFNKIFSELGFTYCDDDSDEGSPDSEQNVTLISKSIAGMKGITPAILKKHFKEFTKEGLIEEILRLFRMFDEVKEYYQSTIGDNEAEVLKKYKSIIENEFFPSRGDGRARLSVAKKAISDFKRVSSSSKAVADIMLFYVETGVRYTDEYGDIDEQFYSSMESMYEKTLKFITENNLKEYFRQRCEKIVDDSDGIGWGFGDGLCDMFENYFGIEE